MPLSFYLCLLAFALCYWAARRSLVNGLIAVLAVGYGYGITRANVPETLSHFIFDSAVLGLYAAQLFRPTSQAMRSRLEGLQGWTELLVFWAIVMFFFPAQDLVVRLVGLRASIFFLPFLLIGARLTSEERYKLALGLAALNLVALAFGGAEFLMGLPQFFPRNQATKIIYVSKDVVGHTSYRIPASFANAHAYGGAMVVTISLVAGALHQKRKQQWHVYLLLMGLAAAVLGVLLSATRQNFIVVAVLVLVLTFSIKSRISYAFGWLVIMGAIAMFASGEARLQRVAELRDTDMITERVSWSVNMSFFELAAKYPFGNGLGGGGSSVPYFLQDYLKDPVAMENEYARIMLEQGIFGLLLWIAFVIWLLSRGKSDPSDPWRQGRRLAWWACMLTFGTALIGVGMFVSIPQNCLLLINAGWIAARQDAFEFEKEDRTVPHAFGSAKQVPTLQRS
jgi:hypothetical protein